jgi:Mn2+/Fe2+ NRAMP family transporter
LIVVGALNGLILPISLGVMLIAAYRRSIVGAYRHSLWLASGGVVVAASMAAMGLWSLWTQIPVLFK